MTDQAKRPALFLAEYATPNAIAQAAMKVRDAGYQQWDCHTPYALHGLDDAMGLKPTRIGIVSFICAIIGVASAVFLMQYTNAFQIDLPFLGPGYEIVVGGKPPGSFPSMVPIMFELGVLLCGFGTLFAMLHLNRLPRHHHPIFESTRCEAATDDKFVLSIEAGDSKFDVEATRAFLESTGADFVELVEEGL